MQARLNLPMVDEEALRRIVSTYLPNCPITSGELKTALPKLAKDRRAIAALREAVRGVPTSHHLNLGDARCMSSVPDDSVHLVLSSPPYWTLKEYPARQAQHGFSQVRRRSHDGTAFVNQPLYSFVKVKATLATWAVCQMCLHHCNFLIAEFPVDIEMETGNRFKTIHIETFFH